MELFKLLGTIAIDSSEAEKSIDNITNESKKIGKSFESSKISAGKSLNQLAAESGKTVDELRSDIMKLAQKYKSEGNDMSTAVKKAYADFGYAAETTHKGVESEVNQTAAKITQKLNDVTNEYKKNTSEMSEATDTTAANVGSASNGIISAFKKIGTAVVTYFAVDKIKDFGQAVMETGMAFDAQMSTVASISGATNEELDALREKAKEMGAATSFSATESAQALEYMAMAGWKTDDMLNGLEGVMNLAAASGEDLATTSDIVTDAMTAFGMSADQSTYFANVLAQTASNSNTNVSMMGETFKYVAPLAGAMGYTIEDMSAAIGLMANSGIKGSQAGTALRGTITNLASPTDTVATAMDALGVSLVDSEGKTKSFGETLNDLRNGFADLSETEKTQYAAAIAGKEGMSGLLAIVNSSEDDFNKLTESIKSCAGASQEMADTRLDNLQGDVTLLKSAWEGVQIAISDKLTPVFRELVQKITDVLPAIQNKVLPIFDKLKSFITSRFVPVFNNVKTLIERNSDTISQFKSNLSKCWEIIKAGVKYLLEFAKWVTSSSNAAQTFRGVVEGLATGFLVYEGVMTAVAIAQQGVELATKKLTAAIERMNTTNPFGWVVLAVSGLVALETTLRGMPSPTEEITYQFSQLDEEEQALIDHISELKDEYDSWADSKDKAVSDTNAEFDYYQSLADELDTIVDKNGQVKKGYEDRAEFIVTTLNDSLGAEIEMNDGVIEKYDEVMVKIDEVIEKKKAEAMLSAAEQPYADAIANLSDAQESYLSQLNGVNKTKGEIYAIDSALHDLNNMSAEDIQRAYGDTEDYATVTADLTAKKEGLNNQLSQENEALADAKEAYLNYNATIANYEGLSAAIISGDTTQINEALVEMSNGFLTAEIADSESLKRQTEDLETKIGDMENAIKEGMPGVTQEQIDQLKTLRDKSKIEWGKAVDDAGNSVQDMSTAMLNNQDSVNAAASQIATEVQEATRIDGSGNGYNFMSTLSNGLYEGGQRAIMTVSEVMSEIRRAAGGYSIETSVTNIVASAKANMPHHAKGGIVTREQVSVVGEDGAEAIVPLERNTEWIDRVAAKVVNSMGGTVSDNRLLSKIDELITTIKSNKIYLDSGTLVGELAPAMDSTLGNISRLKRRGVK